MNVEPGVDLEARMRSAIEDLATIIQQRYPDAVFRIGRGEDDPAIVQLVVVVDVEDTDPVLDLVMDRLLELHDEDLPVFVATERPPARVAAMRERIQAEKGAAVPTALS